MRIKLDSDMIKNISLFESITGAKVKDCFEDNQENLVFVVMQGQIVKAVGKNGSTAKKMKDMLKKKVKIVEYNTNVINFVRSLILPLKPNKIKQEGKIIYMMSDDVRTKGLLIGKAASNLRNYESIVQRYFDIDELRVIDYSEGSEEQKSSEKEDTGKEDSSAVKEDEARETDGGAVAESDDISTDNKESADDSDTNKNQGTATESQDLPAKADDESEKENSAELSEEEKPSNNQ